MALKPTRLPGPDDLTVGSPATAKNVIAVGASENSAYAYPAEEWGLFFEISVADDADLQGTLYSGLPAEFGPPIRMDAQFEAARVVPMSSELGCEQAVNLGALRGNVALIRRGDCYFKQKVWHAQEAGAVAAIVTNVLSADGYHQEALVMGDTDDVPAQITIPSFMVGSAGGALLWDQASAGILRLTFPIPSEMFSLGNLASFSSRGPTYNDMRFKPDIVAPGDQISAAMSDGDLSTYQCAIGDSLTTMSGTSMAAPYVAGAAGIVRQYFREGRLMNGIAEEMTKSRFWPSAALVKAVILHSGKELAVWRDGEMRTAEKLPSFEQGYGSMDLSRVLWVDRCTSSERIEWSSYFVSFSGDGACGTGARVSTLDACRMAAESYGDICRDGGFEVVTVTSQGLPGCYIEKDEDGDVQFKFHDSSTLAGSAAPDRSSVCETAEMPGQGREDWPVKLRVTGRNK